MPNFHTHWLVAINALEAAPAYVQSGWGIYRGKAVDFGTKVRTLLADVKTTDDAKKFEKDVEAQSTKWKLAIGAKGTKEHWYSDPVYVAARDDVSCFAAYMLGACGPDFWVTPSEPRIKIPDVAADQFNLGHYNRTHRQFQASVCAVGKSDELQARVQKSYFHGMATHFAADLIVHQLVNVSAGAYNLLHQLWLSEQVDPDSWGDVLNRLKNWQMHNKVEHFWDSFVRYRCFGDYPELFPECQMPDGAGLPAGFLTRDRVFDLIGNLDVPADVRARLTTTAQADNFKRMIEMPFVFPFQFCDRVRDRRGGLQPFLYDVVITEAHPAQEMHPTIAGERETFQMKDTINARSFSEVKKLRYFSSALNESGEKPYSLSYLNYIVCPRLDRVRELGCDRFYDLGALTMFVETAIPLARRFQSELTQAYNSTDSNASPSIDAIMLPGLGRFWNLDTGLGLAVKNQQRTTSHEVVTVLDFAHVFDTVAQKLDYTRQPEKESYLKNFPDKSSYCAQPTQVFPLRAQSARFNTWNDIQEPDDKAFMARINVGDMLPRQPKSVRDIDAFMFDGAKPTRLKSVSVATQKFSEKSQEIVVTDMLHRLTIELRTSIARIGAQASELGVFLHADDMATDPITAENDSLGMAKEMTELWLSEPKYKVKLVDFQFGDAARSRDGLTGTPIQEFTTTLLSNFETKDVPARKVKKGEWNNVVPYNMAPLNKRNGRNYAVGTGRKYVLHPKSLVNKRIFTPTAENLDIYGDVSPTEQIFFTLYALVKGMDGKVYDVMTKNEVKKEDMPQIRRVDASGFVKIVLYYYLDYAGAFQLQACHIDGVPVGVEQID